LLFICSQFFRVSNAIIAPLLQNDLGLSGEDLGLLSAAFFYAFALAQIPLGPCLDRFGSRVTMSALSLIGAVGALVFALSDSLVTATAGRVLLGLGMAANLMGSMKLFTGWFSPREFATISGLLMALGTVGNMMAATPLALMVEGLGWRGSFLFIGAFTAVLALVFYTVVREGPYASEAVQNTGTKAQGLSLGRRFWTLLTSREYWLISWGTFFRYGTYVAIQGLWIGPYLMAVVGLDPISAGNLILLMNIGFVISSPLGGLLSDRVLMSRKWVVVMGLALMAASQLALGLGVTEWGGLAGLLFLLGVGSSLGLVMYAHIKEVMPDEMTGTALTGINLFTMLGAGVLIHAMGWMVDHWGGVQGGPLGYKAAFLMGFLGSTSALSLYLFTRDTKAHQAPPAM
jgi:MFS family permease